MSGPLSGLLRQLHLIGRVWIAHSNVTRFIKAVDPALKPRNRLTASHQQSPPGVVASARLTAGGQARHRSLKAGGKQLGGNA